MEHNKPRVRFVSQLPDLMVPDDYRQGGSGKKVRIQINPSGEGLEILGDTMHIDELERLLAAVGATTVERVLCG
ncbi:MAG: hypothetical protein JXO49_12600 [Deltaproteobacteria bacterium]|nr:hypothetical protein [Candidatus Anaeroferrophillus wilburensis]MBN2890168.1 hypothetical protein [Deltaproteobacteria bacterium]